MYAILIKTRLPAKDDTIPCRGAGGGEGEGEAKAEPSPTSIHPTTRNPAPPIRPTSELKKIEKIKGTMNP